MMIKIYENITNENEKLKSNWKGIQKFLKKYYNLFIF